MNKRLFIGLLLPSLLMATSVIPSGSDIEPKVVATEKNEKKESAPQTSSKETQDFDDEYWDDFDSFFDFPRVEFPRMVWKRPAHVIQEKEMVTLPDVDVTMSDDKKAVVIAVKGLEIKKEDVAIELYEDKGYATITFPYHEATITMKLWNDEFALSGVKTITEEKKDAKGKVLSSTSYKGYNSVARSLPRRIHVSLLKKMHPHYKDGVLTLTFDLKESKETITVE